MLKLSDLSLESILVIELGFHVVVCHKFATLDQLLLFLDFVELFLEISQLLAFGAEEEVVKLRELEFGFFFLVLLLLSSSSSCRLVVVHVVGVGLWSESACNLVC